MIEIQIEFKPRDVQHVSQEQFRLQARRVDAPFLEEVAAALYDFEHCHNREWRWAAALFSDGTAVLIRASL